MQNFPIPEEKLIKLAQKLLLEDDVSILMLNIILPTKYANSIKLAIVRLEQTRWFSE